jgi:hypothetical protein
MAERWCGGGERNCGASLGASTAQSRQTTNPAHMPKR